MTLGARSRPTKRDSDRDRFFWLFIRRRNVLQAVVSGLNAEQTSLWHHRARPGARGESCRDRDRDPCGHPAGRRLGAQFTRSSLKGSSQISSTSEPKAVGVTNAVA